MKVGAALILVALLLSAGCSKPKEKEESRTEESKSVSISTDLVNKRDGNMLALVNGIPVYKSDLQKRTLDEAIDDEILYQAALRVGVDQVIRPLIENYKKTEIISYYKDKIPDSKLYISDEDIGDFYNKGDFESISVDEISFTSDKLAREFYNRANSGEDFLRLANEYTNLPSIAKMHIKVDNSYRDQFKGKKEGAIIYSNGKNGEYKVIRLNERLVIPYDSVKQSITSNLLRERIYQEALKNPVDEQLNRKIGEFKKNMVLKNFRQNVLAARSQVKEEDILAFYNDHEYQRISVKELIFNDKALAEEAHKRIVSGEEFDSVSEEYSKNQSLAKIRNTFNPPYQDIFKGKNIGVVSEVIQDYGSFKIVKLIKRDKIPLDELRSHITSRVMEKNAERTEKELIQKLRGESKIEIIRN
jgi:hypothetical protein